MAYSFDELSSLRDRVDTVIASVDLAGSVAIGIDREAGRVLVEVSCVDYRSIVPALEHLPEDAVKVVVYEELLTAEAIPPE